MAANESEMMPDSEKASPDMMEENTSAMMAHASLMTHESTAMMMKPNETGMMENETMMMHEPKLVGGGVSKYYQWDSDSFDEANSEGKLIYLEFSASWCPICQEQEPQLIAGFEALNDPAVVGFKIPFKDGQTRAIHDALARKYGVVYQHTKVIIRNGTVLLKSPEEWDKDRFLSEVKKLG